MNIFTLTGNIFVDNEKANESISKTDKKAQSLAGKLGDGIKTAAKWGAGITAAAGVAGGAMLGLAKNTAATTGDIDDMAQRTGVTAEEFQKYAYAAKLSGMETSTLEGAMIKAQKSFADASEGGKTASEAFSKLGLDVSNMTSEGAFDAAIMALADIEDTTQRNAIANDIFGKSYAELAPMLNSGSEGIIALKEEAVALGAVMSNDAVSAGAEFGDTMDKLKAASDGVFNAIGVNLIPIIQQLLDWIIEHMPEIQETASTAFNTFGNAIQFVKDNSDWLIPVLSGLLGSIVALQIISTISGLMDVWKASTIAQTLASGGLNAVLAANPIGAVITAIGLLVTAGVALYQNWDTVKAKAQELYEKIKTVFENVSKKIDPIIDKFVSVKNAISDAIDKLKFWNNSDVEEKEVSVSSKKSVNGSHANGLAYVPFNGYIAELHKGERVLTARENESYENTVNHTGTIKVEGVNNKNELMDIVEIVMDELRREVRLA